MIRKLVLTTFLSVFLIPVSGFAEEAVVPIKELPPPVQVTDAWVAEAPPTATVLAGYMQLENTSEQDRVLTGVVSQDFEKVDIHETVIKENKASMVAHETLSIPAGKTVSLEPGGFHLMLIEAKKPLKAGDTVEVVLHFQENVTQPVKMEVKKRPTENAIDHEHHHH